MASRALDPRQPQQPETVNRSITNEAIAARAYELWQLRGCPIGSAEIDWLEAEQELQSRTGVPKRPRDSEKRPTASVGATEDQVNSTRTVPERVDKHGSKIEEAAGTGTHDSLGG